MVRIIRVRDLGLDSRSIGNNEWADGIAYDRLPTEQSTETDMTEEEIDQFVSTTMRQQSEPVLFGEDLAEGESLCEES